MLAAFGRALGQGTMNNVTLGDDAVTYYETIGGGQGACPDADGPSGIHVAMSNTLNTPIEALELRVPAADGRVLAAPRVWGRGQFRGGDGVVRELEALAPLHYSLITERRRHRPPGAEGGEPGAAGRNLLDGEELPPKAIGRAVAGPAPADRDAGRRGLRPPSLGLIRAALGLCAPPPGVVPPLWGKSGRFPTASPPELSPNGPAPRRGSYLRNTAGARNAASPARPWHHCSQ